MDRRRFTGLTTAGTAYAFTTPFAALTKSARNPPDIRLGGPIYKQYETPDEWIAAIREAGYTAANCPLPLTAGKEEILGYRKAAKDAGIIIAEVGAWSNPVSPDEEQQKAAVEKCIRGLRLADMIEARCCVNISGSRNREYWAGPHPENLNDETFDLVVETTRRIIDEVKPTKTFFTLEAMPWAYPWSPDSYLKLIKAIDRERFAVHLDPMNMVVSPETYFYNGRLIRECFDKLGPYIRSCHAKDIIMREDIYTPQLQELRPGLGKLDYSVFLTELARLDDVPLMMEHLETHQEYQQAAGYIRSVARENGLAV